MNISPKAVRFAEDKAKPEQRLQVQLSRTGLHWEALDEDVSVAGLLAGHGDMTRGALAAV